MDVRSKQKLKKKRTRKNLDDLRKRSRHEVKDIVNSRNQNRLEVKNNNNSLITSNRLTLALFKKSVRSKPATRLSLSKVDNTNNITKAHNPKEFCNSFTNISHQLGCQFSDICKIRETCENNDIEVQSPKSEELLKKNTYGVMNERADSDNSATLNNTARSLLKNRSKELLDSTFEESSICEYLSSSFISSETESDHCAYKKFMHDLPAYLKEHFPALTGSFVNKSIVNLKKSYFGNNNRQKQINTSHENSVNVADHRDSVIQNPMEYIRTSSREHGAKIKQSKLSSCSSSPSLLAFESVPVNSCLFWNSPEYQYFPHKLNQ